MRRRSREPEDPGEALLAVLGATADIPVPATGCWVYGLRGCDRVTFYVGKSASLLWRLGEHHRTYGDAIAGIWLVRCRDDRQMSVTEDFLIDRLQPRMNVYGMADEEARIRERALAKSRQRKAYWVARGDAEAVAEVLSEASLPGVAGA